MARIGKIVTGLLLVWGIVDSSYGESTYDSSLSEFAGPCHLWLGEGLDKRLSRIKKPEATCYVIFEKEWENSKAIFAVYLTKGRITKVVKIDKSGSAEGDVVAGPWGGARVSGECLSDKSPSDSLKNQPLLVV